MAYSKATSPHVVTVAEVDLQAATKLRGYELPDWQFLKAEFEITSPQP